MGIMKRVTRVKLATRATMQSCHSRSPQDIAKNPHFSRDLLVTMERLLMLLAPGTSKWLADLLPGGETEVALGCSQRENDRDGNRRAIGSFMFLCACYDFDLF